MLSSRDPCEPLRLYRNRGDGTFEDVSERAGLADQLGGLNLIQTDFDNDGRLDIFVMRGGWETAVRNSLLRNNGDLTFTDVTERAGLGGPAHRTHSVAWADFDNDGWLDVFVGHEFSWSQLFRNRGDGTFEDVTERAGLRFRSLTKGVVAGDIDNDGWHRPLRLELRRAQPAVPQPGRRPLPGSGARARRRASPTSASRPGSSTTTTTAGRTCWW